MEFEQLLNQLAQGGQRRVLSEANLLNGSLMPSDSNRRC